MLTILQLIVRMKKCNPRVKCGVEFHGSSVVLYWLTPKPYELTFSELQLTVACHEFQRAMKQAEIDMCNYYTP